MVDGELVSAPSVQETLCADPGDSVQLAGQLTEDEAGDLVSRIRRD